MEKIQVLVCHWRGNVPPAAVAAFLKLKPIPISLLVLSLLTGFHWLKCPKYPVTLDMWSTIFSLHKG